MRRIDHADLTGTSVNKVGNTCLIYALASAAFKLELLLAGETPERINRAFVGISDGRVHVH